MLSDAEDRRLLMHLVVLGNSCEWAIIVRVKTIHAASEERTMYNASPNSGRCSVTTYSSVWEALPTERAQLARMKNGLWRDTHILANWRPSTRKVKNDAALGQRKRKNWGLCCFSSLQNAFYRCCKPENCDPLFGGWQYCPGPIWWQLRITRH